MRENWLIALGILVIAAILLDGLRRMFGARRDSLQMSVNMQQGLDRDEEFGNELPGGSARVVAQRRPEDPAVDLADTVKLTDTGRRRRIDFDQIAPILMDVKEDRSQRIEPGFASAEHDELEDDEQEDDFVEDEDYDENDLSEEDGQDEDDDYESEHEDDDGADSDGGSEVPPPRGVKGASPVFDSATAPLGRGESDILGGPRVFERPADQPPPRREPPVVKPTMPVIKARDERSPPPVSQPATTTASTPATTSPAAQASPAPSLSDSQQLRAQQAAAAPKEQEQKPKQMALDDFILISVMARDRSGFPGAALLEILLASGLRYGHRNIFHRYTGNEKEDESLYSVLNAVKPGTFDLNNMDSFQTPGITLLLPLPSPGNAMEAFESMLATARSVADQLNGELRDDQRNVLTGQATEHNRQRIRDFEMQLRKRSR